MIKSLPELQQFITWCRQNGVQHVKIADIEFQISNITIASDQMGIQDSSIPEQLRVPKTAETAESDDDLLFWSSKS